MFESKYFFENGFVSDELNRWNLFIFVPAQHINMSGLLPFLLSQYIVKSMGPHLFVVLKQQQSNHWRWEKYKQQYCFEIVNFKKNELFDDAFTL